MSSAGEGEKTLLAVGTRRHGVAKRMLEGSVSIRALRTADGPVLIVPPEKAF